MTSNNEHTTDWNSYEYAGIETFSDKPIGKEVTFRARVHTVRRISSKLAFLVFRQQLCSIQGVLEVDDQKDDHIRGNWKKWTAQSQVESIMLVKGTLREPPQKVHGTTISHREVLVSDLSIVSHREEQLAFSVYDVEAKPTEEYEISNHTRFANRVIDLRTAASQSIFRIKAGVCNSYRAYLDSHKFIEIHTPKLTGGASESGASVFRVDYFGRPAFLAQSLQLRKQMAILADFERVYEIAPVFRAENSNTHRHLTEFTGLDLEMVLHKHYHEAMHLIDQLLKSIFSTLYERFSHEIDIIHQRYEHKKLVWLEQTPVLTFAEAKRMLRDSGWKYEEEDAIADMKDLGTREEIRLGELVKKKYGTDYFILDKFPTAVRPFYAMPDSSDDAVSNTFDIFLRGQEILTGGQRIHNVKMLKQQMAKRGVFLSDVQEYVESFQFGAPPHAGSGIGLERFVMLFLGLPDIRDASMFPRDPKSLVERPKVLELRHPDANTLNWNSESGADMPRLEDLIANYGDATNTSWLDDRYEVWRHTETAAAVGYVREKKFAIILGNPLCDKSQYESAVRAFLRWLKKEKKLKPLWLLVSKDVEDVLGVKLGWNSFSCTAEERVDLLNLHVHDDRHEVARKLRHAAGEVVITDIPMGVPVSEQVRKECDARMQDWLNAREGTQVHLTQLNPWRDMEHRMYFYATSKEKGEICALVVLAQLSLEHGYQAKYCLDFPGAPSGTIEHITIHALKAAANSGAKKCTFGAAARAELSSGHGISGVQLKILKQAYHTIATRLKLANKTGFREKLGATEDPIYICFPKHGLGPRGIKAILDFFEADPDAP